MTSLPFFFLRIAMSLLIMLTKVRGDATFHVWPKFYQERSYWRWLGRGELHIALRFIKTFQVSPAPPHRRHKQQPSAAALLMFVQTRIVVHEELQTWSHRRIKGHSVSWNNNSMHNVQLQMYTLSGMRCYYFDNDWCISVNIYWGRGKTPTLAYCLTLKGLIF